MTLTKQLNDLKLCLMNDLRGLNIEPMDDYEGFFLVGPDGWTQYTVYCAQDPLLYSAYSAIPDVMKGFDIDDEKPIKERASLFATVSAIKSHHKGYAPELYPDPIPVNSRTEYSMWLEAQREA